MPRRAADDFDAVPVPTDGSALLVANREDHYHLYLHWLADYLYRPEAMPQSLPRLSPGEALMRLMRIEEDIVERIRENPLGDYPFPCDEEGVQPSHADYLHRQRISRILSHIPDHHVRVNLIDRFYVELQRDIRK